MVGSGILCGDGTAPVPFRAGSGEDGLGICQGLRGGGVEFSAALLNGGLLIEDVLLGSPGEGFFCGIQLLLLVRAQRGFFGLELVGGVACLDCFFECGNGGGGAFAVVDGYRRLLTVAGPNRDRS